MTLFASGAPHMTTDTDILYESRLEGLPLLHQGKVRDVYAAGDEHLLIVATDRLSAFDVVLPHTGQGC